MAKWNQQYLVCSANSGGTSSPWVSCADLSHPRFQILTYPGVGSAVGAALSATIVIEGSFDPKVADGAGSVPSYFRIASQAVTTVADMNLLGLSAYDTAGLDPPFLYVRAKVSTLSQGTPGILLRGKVRGFNEEG